MAEDVRTALASGTRDFDHSLWDQLLAAGTRDGLVDYAYFAGRREDLTRYLEAVAAAPLAELEASQLEALLINAYNALTVETILRHPGVASIREIDGVWTDIRHPVAGHRLTLDEIEHNVLRPFFRDPRIHFAVNCASMSCAPLPPWAFTGDDLDAQLDERTRAFLADPRNARLEDGALRLSRYFDWYGDDFTAPDWSPRADSVTAFVAAYAPPELASALADGRTEVRFTDYDWSLNDPARSGS
ncbi:MAG: DUF547 domain-containing protein [Thermoanaerobaculia bacterium]|nr:DUF547 domain-containing protein [Thermoanaerobaculia bacterium]